MTAVLTYTPCAAQQGKYQLKSVQRSRILIDARYDNEKDPKAVSLLSPLQTRCRQYYEPSGSTS